MTKNMTRWTKIAAAALVALGASTSAYATCGQPGQEPCTPQQQLTQLLNSQGQRQGQGQGQAQGQTANGGTALSGSDARAVLDNWNLMTTDQRLNFRDSLNPSARSALDATLTSQSNATIGDIRAGSPVSITMTDARRTQDSVQVARLPQTIVASGITLEQYGSCGPQWEVEPMDNKFLSPAAWGAWNQKLPFKTMHGLLKGRKMVDGKIEGQRSPEQFFIEEFELPAPFSKKWSIAWGHQLYVVTTTATQGGGSGASGNHSAERTTGLGNTLNANGAHASVGVVALPCEFDSTPKVSTKERALPVIPPATPATPLPPMNDAMVPTIIIVQTALPPVPPIPELTLTKKRFLTDEVTHLGPQPNPFKDKCLKTVVGKDGKKTNIWVKKNDPTDFCPINRGTDLAVTGAKGKGIDVK